jgi:hypothetical protein
MPEKNDIQKALDAVLADKFTPEELNTIKVWQGVSTWNLIERASVTLKPLYFSAKFCQLTELLDVSGIARTDLNGTVRFRLTDFICIDGVALDTPINMVATPLGSQPIFLTLNHTLVMDPSNLFGRDVEFEVFTWDADGVAAPDITFDWRCRVVFVDVIKSAGA